MAFHIGKKKATIIGVTLLSQQKQNTKIIHKDDVSLQTKLKTFLHKEKNLCLKK